MRRPALTLMAVVVLGVSTVSACGGDGSDYCNRVRDNIKNKTLENLDLSSASDMQRFIDEYKALEGDAPDEIKHDYDALVKAFQGQKTTAKPDSANQSIEKYDEDNCDVKYTG
ncbi:MAG: hypothetical protein ABJA81_08835 [Nocardioidaceae bacterium]